MATKIQCGVIGAGWWATFAHIPGLQENPQAELVAIQNDHPTEAANIAATFHIPRSYSRVEELLAEEQIQAVIVSSSAHLHYREGRAALEQGKHVLIEKPMTITAAEAAELTSLARDRGLQLVVSCPWHYTAHAREARRLVGEGEVGEIRMVSLLMTNPINDLLRGTSTEPTHGQPYMHPRRGTYSDPKFAGGGQIYTQVCHAAAYVTFLTGARPVEVFARFHNDGAVLDIYDTVSLRMDDGSIVNIASTGATSLGRRDFEVRVFGTKGILFLDLWHGKMEFVPLKGEPRRYASLADEEIYPHKAPARNLIESILDPEANLAPGMLGVAAMEMIEGACRSAQSGTNLLVSCLHGAPR